FEPFPVVDDLAGAATEEDEPVREPGCPLEGDFTMTTEPDRDGPCRLWQECRPVNPIETTREVDNRLGKQLPQKLDLLLLPDTACTELLPESLVLDVVPADAHAQP